MFECPKDYKHLVEGVLPVFDKENGSNKNDFFGVDTICDNKFAQNYGGYPRSDIALINEQQNLSVAAAMLERIPDFGTDVNPNLGMVDAEIVKGVQSKYMQSPAEVLPYLEKQIQNRYDRAMRAAEEKAAAEAAASAAVNSDDVIDKV